MDIEAVETLKERKAILQRKRQELVDEGKNPMFVDKLISATDKRKNEIIKGPDNERPAR